MNKTVEKVIKSIKKVAKVAGPVFGGVIIGVLFCKEYTGMFNNPNQSTGFRPDNDFRRRPRNNDFRGNRPIRNFSERRYNNFNNN